MAAGRHEPGPIVTAIVATHNEADIVEAVVRDLDRHGVRVYVIDDASTDGTFEIAERLLGSGVVGVERFRSPGEPGSDRFDWSALLRRKADLATRLEGDWFLHHDADEFRESPWPGVTLAAAIAEVDAAGYNAIDFVRLDFWPTSADSAESGDIRERLTGFTPPAAYDQLQVRCWKRTAAAVDLTTTGGHEARFEGRRVYPRRFLLRHYPIRSQAHGERKVHRERLPRFTAAERDRGWHVQYDTCGPGTSFVRASGSLTRYDAHARAAALARADLEAADQHLLALARRRRSAQARIQHWLAPVRELRRQDIARMTAALRRHDEAAAAAASQAVDARARAALEQALADARGEVAALRASWSWRVTRPLRLVAGWLR